MKDEDGEEFIVAPPFGLQPMGSCWPNGAVFFSLRFGHLALPFVRCRDGSALAVRPAT